MKTIIVIVLLAIAISAGILWGGPVAVMFYQLSALKDAERLLTQEIQPLSGLVVTEDADDARAGNAKQHVVTVNVSENAITEMITQTLTQKSLPCMTVTGVNARITPETLSVEIASRCSLFGHAVYAMTISSEWLIRSGERIEIKPEWIGVSYAKAMNWASIWKYVTPTWKTDGWYALFSASPSLAVQDIFLQDHEIALAVAL